MLRTLIAVLLMLPGTPAPSAAAEPEPASYVNPLVGTDDSNSPDPVGGGAGGSTFPGATVPFGMVQFSPDTPTASPSGYRDADRTIESFSLTHFNGAGCENNEDLPILPITGALGASPGWFWTGYASAYTKSNERAAAGYYRNRLDRYGVDVELGATARTGALRLTYPATTEARVLINASRSATGNRDGSVRIEGNRVSGEHVAGGFCGGGTYRMYWSIRFDRAPTGVGTFTGLRVDAGSTATSGARTGAYLTFDTRSDPTVTATVGISFVSVAGAEANAAAEAAPFDAVRDRATKDWNDMLGRVAVTGGGDTDRQKFATALYHVLMNPNLASDVDGRYRGFDGQVHTAAHPVYQNYSGWDIYRSWAALVALVAPDVMTDIVRSMVLDGQQGGALPKWSQQNVEDFVMVGDPGPIVVASAHAFGVADFDTGAALDLMKASATGGTSQGRVLRGNRAPYEKQHFIPGNPSETLEYAASDFAISRFARALGDDEAYRTYARQSQNWRSLFNGESSYLQSRAGSGAWQGPLDPAVERPYVEGNASQYTWMVPHDLGALVTLMGGPITVAQRLDHHMTELNGGLSRPYFYVGNEPEHGVPWTYHYARRPDAASAAVRRVMAESFTTGAGGLPGNDDLGATSAWYVWAALGLYPVTPGADTLAVHGGLFPSVTIRRPGGDLTFTGGSADQQYVQGLSVNGTATSHSWLRYADLAGGGTVAYRMGPSPSAEWGTAAGDVPPSFPDGATPPPAEPELGPNLALRRPVVAGAAACSAAEAPANAADGRLAGNSKWCSTATPRTLTADLGATKPVTAFVVKHAGLGGERTVWNTSGYTIATSVDGVTWTNAVTVTGSARSRSYLPIPSRTARYVRLDVTAPTGTSDGASRVYELEVYDAPTADLALRRPATAGAQCSASEGPDRAVDGSWLGGWGDKWCATGANRWMQVDLGERTHVGTVVVRHAGAGGEYPAWNTRDFDLLTSDDGVTWTPRVLVRGNTADSTTSTIDADARYVRIAVLTPTSDGDGAARIYALEVRA